MSKAAEPFNIPSAPAVLLRHTLSEKDCRLGVGHASVLAAAGSLFGNIPHGQV